MSMPTIQYLYKFIYNRYTNFLLRNLNRFLYTLGLTKFKLPPTGEITLNTKSGNLVIATNQTSYITQLLFWHGYNNFEYSIIFEKIITKTKVFLDIGANIGYYSLLGVKANPSLKAYAFEPALGPKHYLKRNIIRNDFHNQITHIDKALSTQKGTIDFYEVANKKYKYLEHNLAGEGNAGTKTTGRNYVKNRVEAISLNDFANQINADSIDLIKIDTEGTEVSILESGKATIERYQPIVICETLFNTTEKELETFFKSLNYLIFNHTKKGLQKTSSIIREKDNGIRNCFFVPKTKEHIISEFVIND